MYTEPHQMQPMLPSEHAWLRISEKAERVVTLSATNAAAVPAETRKELRGLVRSMNSYYSNRIEGQGTHPLNIERALHNDFSDSPDVAALQRLALAHIEAEIELEALAATGLRPLSISFAQSAHVALYGRLSPNDRKTKDGEIVIPGEIRTRNVTVGRHIPPDYASLPLFLDLFDQSYAKDWTPQKNLVATACAHHRFSWIHPFIDGNGRTSRLQTHTSMLPLSHGLWSVNRGLARNKDNYYSNLAAADTPRQGDLDGRGNLSEKGLRQWIEYFLDTCLDQVQFMEQILDLKRIRQRITALVAVHSSQKSSKLKMEVINPLMYLFAVGELTRGDFAQMTGLGERTARSALSEALRIGIVKSDTKLGPLRFGFPLESLSILLPNLYPEASAANIEDRL